MSTSPRIVPAARHLGPHLGALAIVVAVLSIAGAGFVLSSSTGFPPVPPPWSPPDAVGAYVSEHAHAALMCAWLQFGAAIPLGLFTATAVSRLRFLGIRVAGAHIALFGGLMAAFNLASAGLVLWVLAQPGTAQDTALMLALYRLVFAFGGVGLSVPLGLLIAGLSIPSGFMKLLPPWLVALGLLIAVCGELSWFCFIFRPAILLIPVTRLAGTLWLIAAGFLLPVTTTKEMEAAVLERERRSA
jgi:hypothetical protein